MITEAWKKDMLKFVREVIASRLHGQPSPWSGAEWAGEPGACFVTLTCGGSLRGCIGTLRSYRSLGEDLRENALAAAFEDPRFPPLRLEEWASTRIEISLLTPPLPWTPSHPSRTAQELETLKPGVLLSKGYHRATFLPQVWDQLPSGPEFLSRLCQKAGLFPQAWEEPGLDYEIYQVEKWGERP